MNLKGSPRYVGRDFICGSDNPNLNSLIGSPDYVGRDFWCQSSRILSLEGAPEVIKGNFVSDEFTDEDYRKFVKKRELDKRVSKELDKDFDVNVLNDFE